MPMPSSPDRPDRAQGATAPHPADVARCRALLRAGSRSFFAASLLLPAHVRTSATVLYAFCRLADDDVDAPADACPREAVTRLHRRLDAVYGPEIPARATDRALAAVVRQHELPRGLLDALIEGLAWDAAGRTYETLEDLQAYAARVAGSVGAAMAVLMGVRSAGALARACDLGVAMQLTNIARDVGEDAAMGRLYLPRLWMREAGLDPDAWLARPAFVPALAAVVQRLLDEADILYRRVDAGIAELPRDCRPGIQAARALYAAIGEEVRSRGGNSVDARAVVPRARQWQLLWRAWLAPLHPGAPDVPPLGATHYLVAAAARPVPASPAALAPRWALGQRWRWALDLFEQVERRPRRITATPRGLP